MCPDMAVGLLAASSDGCTAAGGAIGSRAAFVSYELQFFDEAISAFRQHH
jgi:hypothetical protein